MNSKLPILPLLFLTLTAFSAPASQTWSDRTFRITDFGAVAGGAELCTESIQRAVDVCAESGGGRVVVPRGTFLTGTIVLKNGVNLHLEEGAVLLGSPWMCDYPRKAPLARVRYEKYLAVSLVFAQGARDVSVSGGGTLNGNSKSENDFLSEERAAKHRPGLIWFDECVNVVVKGVTFTSAGFWTETYTQCRNVHVDGITVRDSTFRNNDGCNFIDCENAIVENCNIDALDDGICLKGYTAEGCKNIVIRNNRVRSLCNGIKAGTDSSGGFENILIEDNVVWQTGISGIALEVVDGGVMRNVVVRNVTMDVVETPIFIKLGDRNRPIYQPDGSNLAPGPGEIRDVHISGIRATVNNAEKLSDAERAMHNYAPYVSSITGIPGHYVEDIEIRDVEIEILGGFPPGAAENAEKTIAENSKSYPENRMFGTLPAYAFYIRHAKNLRLSDIRVTLRQEDARPAFVLDDVRDSVFKNVRTESASQAQAFNMAENCTNVSVTTDP